MPEPQKPWRDRIWREFRVGNLTRAMRDVLLTLHTFRGYGGVAWPSHDTLADRARCSPATVLRALKQARDLGLVVWAERRVRAGWRWLRRSNLYRFLAPNGPVQAGLRPRSVVPSRTNRQSADGGENEGRKQALEEMLRQAATAPDLLLRRRQVMAAQLARRNWAGV
jgi:Helix-turn-helix domain